MSSSSLIGSFATSLLFSALSLMLLVRHAQCWPLSESDVPSDGEPDPRPIALLRELEQRQIALKEQQAYNEHLANVLYALAVKSANGGDQPDGNLVDHRLLYRASRSHGKPTFIRFGKRAAPAFIRFGKRANDQFTDSASSPSQQNSVISGKETN